MGQMLISMLPVIAGVISPALMTIGLFVWQNRWKYTALELNAFKGCFASLSLGIIASATTESFADAYDPQTVGYMMLCGTLGVIIADTWWLMAMEILGARKMIAVDTLKPFASVVFGSFFLGDALSMHGIAGICVTTIGVCMVNHERVGPSVNASVKVQLKNQAGFVGILPSSPTIKSTASGSFDRSAEHVATDHAYDQESAIRSASSPLTDHSNTGQDRWQLFVAYLYAVGNVLLDLYAATLVVRFHGSMSVADINFVKFGFSGAVLAAIVRMKRSWQSSVESDEIETDESRGKMDRSDWGAVAGGTIFVTVITPMLTTWTYLTLPMAFAVTLNSLGPLWSLPVARWNGESVSPRATGGAILATGGIILLASGT